MPKMILNKDAFPHERTVFLDLDGVVWKHLGDYTFEYLHQNTMHKFLSFLRDNKVNICFLTSGIWDNDCLNKYLATMQTDPPLVYQLVNRTIADNEDYKQFMTEKFNQIVTVVNNTRPDIIATVQQQLTAFPRYFPKITSLLFICDLFKLKAKDSLLIDDSDIHVTTAIQGEYSLKTLYILSKKALSEQIHLKLDLKDPLTLKFIAPFPAYKYAPLDNKMQTPEELIDAVKNQLKLEAISEPPSRKKRKMGN